MKNISLIVLSLLLVFAKSQDVDFMEVQLEQGRVRGFRSEGRRAFSFLGIPYATAPTGADKFKAPLPPRSWDGTMDATETVMCPQIYYTSNSFSGVEDCLIVNVFVPDSIQPNDRSSVLVFIHGGGFILGYGNTYLGGNRLVDQDIIVVTFNYRIGALGYLCLRTEDVPGNAALKDQVAALHWVKNNIANFGGNPDDVTLYGSSGGSVSVEQLTLSKATEGLFNKIILESGSPVGGWAVTHDPIADAKYIAGIMGYENIDDPDTLADIYINATPEELVLAVHHHFTSSPMPFLFRACIEIELDDYSVLTDSPMNILKSGNYNPVSVMMAYMNMEGIMFLDYWNQGWDTIYDENFAAFLVPDLAFENEEEKNEVAQTIKDFYVDRSESDLRAFIDFQTDTYFSYSIIKSAQLHAANSAPVYLMEFSYPDTVTGFGGASHSDLYLNVFEIWLKGGDLVADRTASIFGNFIKHGNPVPTTSDLLPVSWLPVTSTAINYMSLGEEMTSRLSPLPERYAFWNDLYEKYYNEVPVPDAPNDGVEFLEVMLEQGPVRGFRSADRQRFSFTGIPYATTPVGEHRFQDPLPPPSWTETLDATNIVLCPQLTFIGNNYAGTEDCLVVNVFLPANIQLTDTRSVMVFIHGGAFINGFGDILTGSKLQNQGLIIVTINYRLGALGLLCLGTEEAPGNAGLKDQVEALRWVRRNIANFGGNPDDVTLYGCSAGSVSVSLLALSDATEGLFNKIILESGTATSGWAVSYDPIGAATTIADAMGYGANINDVDTLIEIYRSAPAELLVSATATQGITFVPCIERHFEHSSAILTDSPKNILLSGNYTKRPTIVAYMDMEGLMFLNNWFAEWETKFEHESISELLLPDLAFESDIEKNEVAETIKQFYLDRSDSALNAFIDLQTDMNFFYSSVEIAQFHAAESAPVYLMEFSHHDSTGPFSGASHADLYMHVFEVLLRGAGGELAADRITTMFGNFAKHGNPVPITSDLLPVSWPPVTSTAINYMSFGEEMTSRQSPLPERYAFWKDLYEKYYNEVPVPDAPNDGVEFLEVMLEQGPVRGFRSADRQHFSFTGIPYATTPVGEHRFQDPLPPPSWTETLDATNNVMCPQLTIIGNNYAGTEDCLVVNVFLPANIQLTDTRSVMVFIHGGAFINGAGPILTGSKLPNQGIIMVTMNYRLGALGLLCLGTEEAPGNAGLKDQVEALRWVRRNIANFGGNPDDVTLYGCSAGSVSVSLLALSDATEGLFNKIILESGTATSGWAVSYDPIGAATTIADAMGYGANINDVDTLIDIYRSAPAELLVSATATQGITFTPCIERHFEHSSAILTDSPKNTLLSGNYTKRPTIVAYMDMEGLMFLNNWFAEWETKFEDESISELLLPDLAFENDMEKNEVAETIKQFYLERSDSALNAFIDLQTDMNFFYSSVEIAQFHAAESAPVYLMEFSHHDSTGPFSGASHADLFLHVFEILLSGAGGELAADRITTMFGNFAKYGNPVPITSDLLPVSWPPVTSTAINYMSFGEELTSRQSPQPERYAFWKDIFDKHYRELPHPDDEPSSSYKVTGSVLTVALVVFCSFMNIVFDV